MSGREVGIAAALALALIVLAPGLAVVALIAGVVLAGCVISLGFHRLRRTRGARRPRRSRRRPGD